ncbi:MAG: hypothetical protein HOE19_01695 [Candidatus Komeilibacteria bacterium]|nr:hypothetical protein [Candidatus Komeilibacteria bacterium]MBT4447504.1 hypothetical protein [Candidatus Komeilibacteria bacterium]
MVALDIDETGNVQSHAKDIPERPFLRKEKVDPDSPPYEIDTNEHLLVIHIDQGHIKCVQDDEEEMLTTGTTVVMQPHSQCTLKDAGAETHLSFIWQA